MAQSEAYNIQKDEILSPLLELLGPNEGDIILEIGCGYGCLAKLLSDKVWLSLCTCDVHMMLLSKKQVLYVPVEKSHTLTLKNSQSVHKNEWVGSMLCFSETSYLESTCSKIFEFWKGLPV